jgi:hypothetical protein
VRELVTTSSRTAEGFRRNDYIKKW